MCFSRSTPSECTGTGCFYCLCWTRLWSPARTGLRRNPQTVDLMTTLGYQNRDFNEDVNEGACSAFLFSCLYNPIVSF